MNYFVGYDRKKARHVDSEVINASSGVLGVIRIPKKLKAHPYELYQR